MSTDLRQTDSWAKYLGGQGWKTEELKVKNSKCKIYIRKIPLLGSVIKIQRPAEIPPIEEIDRIAKKHRTLLVKLEPAYNSKLTANRLGGFEPGRNPNLPTRTILIDLTKSEEELWKNLSQDARQSVRKTHSKQLTVNSYRFGNSNFEPALQKFHLLLRETGKRQKFWTGDYSQLQAKVDAFGKDALVFLVTGDRGQPLAGSLILLAGDTAYYHHTASNEEGQKLFAPYFLMWEIFRYLKNPTNQPIRYLEFEGIADPRFPQTRRWKGFTVFKRKWGGEEIEFPLPLIKYYHPLVRLLFKLGV